MAQQGILDKFREWIGGVAFAILLWSLRMTEDEYYDEQTRVAEQRDAPVHAEQKCPFCKGDGYWHNEKNETQWCDMCAGTGISKRSAGG